MSSKRRRCEDASLTIGVEISNEPQPYQIINKEEQPKPLTNSKGRENQKMTYNIDPGGTAFNLEQDPLPVIPGLLSIRDAILAKKYLSAEHFHKKVSSAYIISRHYFMIIY